MAESSGLNGNPWQFSFKVQERSRFGGTSGFNIVTKMMVSFWMHTLSMTQALVPVLFELLDGGKPIVSWKVKFLWPRKDKGLYKFLENFALTVLVTKQIMCDYGMSVTMALHGILEQEKEMEAEMQKIENLASEAHERGIIILDSRLLEAPHSEIGFPHIAMYLDADLKPFRWQKYMENKVEKKQMRKRKRRRRRRKRQL